MISSPLDDIYKAEKYEKRTGGIEQMNCGFVTRHQNVYGKYAGN